MKRVLVIQKIHDDGLALLRDRPDVEFDLLDGNDEAEIVRRVRDVDAIIVRTAVINRTVLDAAPKVGIVSRHGVGYDAVDTVACRERDIPVTITPGANSTSVAEHAMFMLLALAKSCRPYDEATRTDRFLAARNSMTAVDLEGRTLLIVGFGRTGSRVAPRALAFGMRVLACDPYVAPDLIRAAGAEPVTDLGAALAESHAVTLHTPFTSETNGLLGATELAAMPRGGYIINTARGGVVDETALDAALGTGQIAGAGLDVFVGEPDPPPVDHPLFRHDNVIVSPHSAGVSVEAMQRTGTHAARNVCDFFDGRLDPAVIVN